ncbi:MAG: UDP-N-acetylmuramoylalanine--D-glutamate ligase [Planctomycetota bacterium]|jgi:UDP-N-acetylmuramoylalanine--D-glutamate ligase
MNNPGSSSRRGQRVTVMGLGLFGGGAAVARYLAEAGAQVTVTDLRDERLLEPALKTLLGLDLEFVLGRHRPRDFIACDLVVANPAIAPDNPHLQNSLRAGIPVTSEIALFLDACPARVAAITGTQGKSSTTSFLAQLLTATGHTTHLGGNIGRSLLADLPSMSETDICALELSSYQLEELPEHMRRARTDSVIEVAAIVNILEDHLERHGNRAEYARAKLRLFEVLRPGGTMIMPAKHLPVEFNAPEDTKLLVPGGTILRIEDGEFRLASDGLGRTDCVPMRAPFQIENLLVALGLAALLGAQTKDLAAALSGLQGLPHRLDLVGELEGRPLWDNGVSTTPDSTISAIQALPPGAVVLLGGRTKPLDLAPLLTTLSNRDASVVLFGSARETWAEPLSSAGIDTLQAVGPEEALELALSVDASSILFSPACSSFDAYPNFEVRARSFLARAKTLGLRERPSL